MVVGHPAQRAAPQGRGAPIALLRIASGVYRGKVFPVEPDRTLLVGKALEADFTIPDAGLEPFHCRLSFEAGRGARVKVLSKDAHVEVHGALVDEALVRPRERFKIGDTTIEYLEGERRGSAAGDPAPYGTVCGACGLLVPRVGGGRILLGTCYCCRCVDLRLTVRRDLGEMKVLRKTKSDTNEIVYVAEDLRQSPPARVSLHVLKAERCRELRARRRFLAAGAYGRMLDHPVFPRTLDITVRRDIVSYATDRVEWDSVDERVGRGETIPLDRALAACLSLVDALRYARRRGLTIPKLRGARLFANEKGDIRIVDFALRLEAERAVAADVDALDPSIAGRGHPGSERLRPVRVAANGDPDVIPFDLGTGGAEGGAEEAAEPEETDIDPTESEVRQIKPIGIVLVKLSTATPPTLQDTPQDIVQRITKAHRKHRPKTTVARRGCDVPAVVGKVIARTLAPNPVNRYRTLDDLRRDILAAHQAM